MVKLRAFYLCIFIAEISAQKNTVKRQQSTLTTPSPTDKVESWSGKWFPHPPYLKDPWTGTWFPHHPYAIPYVYRAPHELSASDICDDGKHFIGVDYDPNNIRQTLEHLCLANRTLYMPNMNREAWQREYLIPPAYVAPVKCLNETIDYDIPLPTYGAFRPISAKYGTYINLPAQRWMGSLAKGAIVMLYHPCANTGQVRLLQNILRSCLYRHIITPSQALSSERPLALLAWGKSLEMSVVDNYMVVNFIKENSKQGQIVAWNQKNTTKTYAADLKQEAHLVTDENDSEVCGYIKEM